MIQIQHLTKTFTDIKALSDISLSVTKGELFGLIGPDGAGKTSLFRILTGLLLPDQGTARVMEWDIIADYKKIRAEVGYMPGKFSLYQDLTIEENIDFFAKLFKTTFEENREMIEEIYVQIEPFKHRRAGKLSGGMKQKLALCCALIHKPRVLFLDEPTTGVDPVSRKEFWEMLQKIKAMGITIMVSTPYMDEALLCDRIALIQKGEILSINTPQAIIAAYPKTLYALQSANNYQLMRYLRKRKEIDSCYMFGEYLHVSLNTQAEKECNWDLMLQQSPYEVKEHKIIEASIEDCFIRLLGTT